MAQCLDTEETFPSAFRSCGIRSISGQLCKLYCRTVGEIDYIQRPTAGSTRYSNITSILIADAAVIVSSRASSLTHCELFIPVYIGHRAGSVIFKVQSRTIEGK